MDRVTKAKIESLLYHLRGLPQGAGKQDVEELARRFQLDPLMVQRIAETEGFELDGVVGDSEASNPRSPTGILDIEDAPWMNEDDEDD